MSSQVLRLLVVFLLLESAYGIACYQCETKTIQEQVRDADPVAVEVKVEDGAAGSRSARRARDADPAAPTPAPAPAADVIVEVVKQRRLESWVPECEVSGKDDPKNWEEKECADMFRACYILKGTIAERQDKNVTLYKILRRGCFHKDAGDSLLNSAIGKKKVVHEKDKRTEGDFKTEKGTFKGSAKLIICDDLNGGEMLCNTGITMRGQVNYFALFGAIAFLHLLCLLTSNVL